MINFLDWFDITDINHLVAYKYLQKEGLWPKGFIPENIYMPINWQVSLAFKMADAWADQWV